MANINTVLARILQALSGGQAWGNPSVPGGSPPWATPGINPNLPYPGLPSGQVPSMPQTGAIPGTSPLSAIAQLLLASIGKNAGYRSAGFANEIQRQQQLAAQRQALANDWILGQQRLGLEQERLKAEKEAARQRNVEWQEEQARTNRQIRLAEEQLRLQQERARLDQERAEAAERRSIAAARANIMQALRQDIDKLLSDGGYSPEQARELGEMAAETIGLTGDDASLIGKYAASVAKRRVSAKDKTIPADIQSTEHLIKLVQEAQGVDRKTATRIVLDAKLRQQTQTGADPLAAARLAAQTFGMGAQIGGIPPEELMKRANQFMEWAKTPTPQAAAPAPQGPISKSASDAAREAAARAAKLADQERIPDEEMEKRIIEASVERGLTIDAAYEIVKEFRRLRGKK